MLKPVLCRVAAFVGGALLSSAALSAATQVSYPAGEGAGDTRHDDVIEILRTALSKTVAEFGPFELQAAARKLNKEQILSELKAGKTINIAWGPTSVEKEADMLPLRIPLRKGLLGYRIALIQKDKQAELDKVKSLSELKKLSILQGSGWSDVKLYEANGFKVSTAKYDELFKMTASGGIDLFPRGLSEVFGEHQKNLKNNPDLAIEQGMLIYYPWPYYFFFNKNETALHKRLDTGIRKMMKDGSFDAIFRKYNGKAIEQANFKGRRIFRIKNDILPKETPFDDPSLWFNPLNY